MSVEMWAAILAAAALLLSLVSLYIAAHSARAAERSALAAARSADAAEDQARAVERANELVEQAQRRGVRAPDAWMPAARAVGWDVERTSNPNRLLLRNVGEAPATNVSVEPSDWVYIIGDSAAANAGLGGPTVEVHEALELGVMATAEFSIPTLLQVSWEGVLRPVPVPIPAL
ncbi:MAG TPA: hypothetical protein VIP06_02785 [Nocardioides sp.]